MFDGSGQFSRHCFSARLLQQKPLSIKCSVRIAHESSLAGTGSGNKCRLHATPATPAAPSWAKWRGSPTKGRCPKPTFANQHSTPACARSTRQAILAFAGLCLAAASPAAAHVILTPFHALQTPCIPHFSVLTIKSTPPSRCLAPWDGR
jgi:hypothetical protein